MSPKERRAFAFGYRIALKRARAELRAMAASWDAKVASVQEEAHKQTRAMAENFNAEIASLQDEARRELHNLATSFGAEIGNAIARRVHREKINRAVEQAAAERATIPDTWLH
jgi:hypothetical protein